MSTLVGRGLSDSRLSSALLCVRLPNCMLVLLARGAYPLEWIPGLGQSPRCPPLSHRLAHARSGGGEGPIAEEMTVLNGMGPLILDL